MKISALASLGALGLLMAITAALASRFVLQAFPRQVARLELARVRPTRLEAELVQRLAILQTPIDISYFVSPVERLDFEQRELRTRVEELLENLARASRGRLTYRVLEPERDPATAQLARDFGAHPVRLRTLEQDAWTEVELESTLSIAVGSRPRTRIIGLLPEHLGQLQGWIWAHIEERLQPTSARIALLAPDSFERLAEHLPDYGAFTRVQAVAEASAADLLVWIEPQRFEAADEEALRARIDRGQCTLLAGSGWSGDGKADTPAGVSGQAFERAAAALGVSLLPGRVHDERTDKRPGDSSLEAGGATWRVASIAQQQDFRALAGQPNGTIVFVSASALAPDLARLDRLGLDFSVLASASPSAWLASGDASTQPAPSATLAALLSPRDGRRGKVALLGSAAPFTSDQLERSELAHAALQRVLVQGLTSREQRMAARGASVQISPARTLQPGARTFWRLLGVLGPAALFAGLWLVRARLGASRGQQRAKAPRGLGLAALALGALALLTLASSRVPVPRLDLTRERLHSLDPGTVDLAKALQGDLRAEWILPRSLPPPLQDLPRRASDLLQALEPHLQGQLRLSTTRSEDLAPERLASLERLGLVPATISSREGDATRVREFRAGLLLEAQGRTQLLRFPNGQSAEHLEFRLALAMARLAGQSLGKIAVASDTPRLSPAEAHTEFQKKGLFAPGGADVFALARAWLAENDFQVVPLAPQGSKLPADLDLLVWLQPRRGGLQAMAPLASYLHTGGTALVAMQHYRVQARQEPFGPRETVYWPEPQFCDFSADYLAPLGASLVQEVLCDPPGALLPVATQVRTGSGDREFSVQQGAQPFHLRAAAARFDQRAPFLAGLGDQVFESGNRFALDASKLAANRISARVLMTTSERAWSIDWLGGVLGPKELQSPPAERALAAPAALAVAFEGLFPLPAAAAEPSQDPVPQARPGRLIALGASSLFRNDRLREGEFRGDHLLLNLAAELALGPPFARLAGRRSVAQAFEPPSKGARAFMRGLGLGAMPLVCLCLYVWTRRQGARNETAYAPLRAP